MKQLVRYVVVAVVVVVVIVVIVVIVVVVDFVLCVSLAVALFSQSPLHFLLFHFLRLRKESAWH